MKWRESAQRRESERSGGWGGRMCVVYRCIIWYIFAYKYCSIPYRRFLVCEITRMCVRSSVLMLVYMRTYTCVYDDGDDDAYLIDWPASRPSGSMIFGKKKALWMSDFIPLSLSLSLSFLILKNGKPREGKDAVDQPISTLIERTLDAVWIWTEHSLRPCPVLG